MYGGGGGGPRLGLDSHEAQLAFLLVPWGRGPELHDAELPQLQRGTCPGPFQGLTSSLQASAKEGVAVGSHTCPQEEPSLCLGIAGPGRSGHLPPGVHSERPLCHTAF